ncbi:hypothetical protein GCM10025779_28180 [Arthrobacter cryoconiti]
MEPAGISDGDELIVNRALEPRDGSVVIAVLDGELTVKRLRITARGATSPGPDHEIGNPKECGRPGVRRHREHENIEQIVQQMGKEEPRFCWCVSLGFRPHRSTRGPHVQPVSD